MQKKHVVGIVNMKVKIIYVMIVKSKIKYMMIIIALVIVQKYIKYMIKIKTNVFHVMVNILIPMITHALINVLIVTKLMKKIKYVLIVNQIYL